VTIRRLYNFMIDEDLDDGLKRVKARDGISESEQIRRALRAWLKKHENLKLARRASTRRIDERRQR